MGKDKLNTLLGNTPGAKPDIRRGAGYKLSTEATEESELTQSQNRTNAKEKAIERVTRGYRFREDLIDAYKYLALQQKRKLYQVMETALEEYLERQKEK